MPRYAFIDSSSGVLKTHGYVETNEVGDTRLEVSEDFMLKPGRWRWNAGLWELFTPPQTKGQRLVQELDTAIANPIIPPSLKPFLQALRDLFT